MKNNFVYVQALCTDLGAKLTRSLYRLIYELLDGMLRPRALPAVGRADLSRLSSSEILDFGYPQNSESDTLKMYITTEGVKSEQAVVRLRFGLRTRPGS